MKRFFQWCSFAAIAVIASPAAGQTIPGIRPVQSGQGNRTPLTQLPPIVSPAPSPASPGMLQPMPQASLPPVVQAAPTAWPQRGPTQAPRGVAPIYSRAGVPLRRGSNPNAGPAPVGMPSFDMPAAPTRQDSVSPTGPTDLPGIPSAPMSQIESSLSPGQELPSVPAVELDAPSSVVEPVPTGSAPDVIAPPASVSHGTPGSNDYFDQGPIAHQPGAPINGNSGCSTCGAGGCYDLRTVQNQFGCCGSVVSAGYYLFAEGLAWTREDGDIQLSTFFGLNDFDFGGGWRFTLGYRQNATRGREFTYFGTTDLTESRTVNNAMGLLNSRFTADGGFGFAQVSSFFNATQQTQAKESQLQSMEFNRVNWSWDLLKTIIGVRYIYFDDSYSFFSTNGVNNGLFVMDSVNNLFGLHAGYELFYDVGYRTSVSLTNKYGGYVNSANVDTNLFNGGVQFLSQDQDDSAFASTIELGLMSHIQLRPQARLRLGYDLLLMWGAFTVENNAPRDTFARGFQTGLPVITPTTGADLNTNNEAVFFHGLSFGFEVFR